MVNQVDPEDATRSAPRIPIADFPRLPDRGQGYWSEPWLGVCVVSGLSAVLVAITHGVSVSRLSEASPEDDMTQTKTVLALIWAEAITAVLATLFILFAGAGVIKRSPDTCYPMPPEVEERLRSRGMSGSSGTTEGMDNIRGYSQRGMPNGSYCVRCLVWRKQDEKAHHCCVCQRCVTGFDHHCGVFGRCIVRGNMPCFCYVIAMMFAGMVTLMVAVASGDEPGVR